MEIKKLNKTVTDTIIQPKKNGVTFQEVEVEIDGKDDWNSELQLCFEISGKPDIEQKVINDNKYGYGDVEYVIEDGYYFREISESEEEEYQGSYEQEESNTNNYTNNTCINFDNQKRGSGILREGSIEKRNQLELELNKNNKGKGVYNTQNDFDNVERKSAKVNNIAPTITKDIGDYSNSIIKKNVRGQSVDKNKNNLEKDNTKGSELLINEEKVSKKVPMLDFEKLNKRNEINVPNSERKKEEDVKNVGVNKHNSERIRRENSKSINFTKGINEEINNKEETIATNRSSSLPNNRDRNNRTPVRSINPARNNNRLQESPPEKPLISIIKGNKNKNQPPIVPLNKPLQNKYATPINPNKALNNEESPPREKDLIKNTSFSTPINKTENNIRKSPMVKNESLNENKNIQNASPVISNKNQSAYKKKQISKINTNEKKCKCIGKFAIERKSKQKGIKQCQGIHKVGLAVVK